MYLSYYHLREKPFQISTDPRFLWYGEKHSEALANLRYGLLERNGYVVLTGDVGTGKTTLINALLASLNDKVLFANINHPKMDTIEFMHFVARKFDPAVSVSSKSDLLSFFQTFLQKAHARGKVVLLVVDEAQQLTMDLLEELRLLSNLEKAGQRLINIILVGQHELKTLLLDPQCRAMRQRITLFYEIQPLSLEETGDYVSHRLKVAGTQEALFSPKALCEIYRFSQGRPRLINTICDRALLTGYVQERKMIDAHMVAECAREMQFLSPKARLHRITPLSLHSPSWIAKYIKHPLESADVQQKHSGTGAPVSNLQHRWHNLIQAMLVGGRDFLQNNRRKIVPAALAAVIALMYALMAIGLYPEVSVKTVESTQAAQNAAENKSMGSNDSYGPDPPAPNDRGRATEPEQDKAMAASGPSTQNPAIKIPPTSNTRPPAHTIHDETAGTTPVEISSASVKPVQTSQNPGAEESAGTEAAPPKAKGPDPLALAAVALAQNDFKWAIELLEAHRSPDTNDGTASATLYSRALVGRANRIMARSPHQAEAMLQKAIAANSQNARAHFSLGRLHMQTKHYAQAIEAYQKAIYLDPALPDAFFNLGFIYATTGIYNAAEKSFTQAIELKPDYLDKALFNLAMVQQKLGKRQAALASLEEAVAFRPQNKKARVYLQQFKKAEPGR